MKSPDLIKQKKIPVPSSQEGIKRRATPRPSLISSPSIHSNKKLNMSYSLTNRLFSDALRDMQRAMAAFEQPLFAAPTGTLMGPSSNAPSSLSRSTHGTFYPTTDMVETPDAYELHAELPGYDKKDIKIEMSDSNTLVISGNVAKEYKSQGPSEDTATDATTDEASTSKESQQLATTAKDQDKQVGQHSVGHKWLVRERTSGSFVRTFTLPIAVKPETIKASYNNGVLKVVIPKAENKQANNQINIE
ncbi:heat shock protein Hsp30/Hsp42 [Mucor ambiguus]|uniref:Heat shock protein Hsp30/Hsp42 n=1 Tax=Mucor ambiguus TaxID=91626 RepID=A0A0C9LPL6_9FUNG|nr:heat shock protein Hsp30/Hsp42 [Mucor ambiguus]